MHRAASVIAVAATAVSSVHATPDFVAVSNANFPIDTLVGFDSADPSKADHASPLASLSGPFTRGLALTDFDTGWYIRTNVIDPANDSAGLYRLSAGTSTLVAAQPFDLSNETGGLDFTADGSALWAVIDPGDPAGDDDELYRIDFDGTYTKIGEIAIAGATGSLRISGIATDPATGDIIAIDGLRDQLYRINPATAQGTIIGSLGINFSNLTSGMDFSSDGRLFAANNTQGGAMLYELDLASGYVIASMGQFNFGVSSISAVPSPSVAGGLVVGALLMNRRRRN